MLSKNSLGCEHFKDQNNVHSFLCTICYSVPRPDIAFELIECGHIFCEECLNGLIKVAQPCPNCKRPIGSSYRSLKTGNKVAYRILMGLEVKCPKQCSWSGPWSCLDGHLANCGKVSGNKYGYPYTPFKGISDEREEDERFKLEYDFTFAESYIEVFRWSISERKNIALPPVVSQESERPLVFALGNNYKVSVHEHLLKYVEKDGWICNGMSIPGGCKSKFTPSGGFGQTKGKPRFRCSDCDYDLCEKCVEAYLTN